MNERRARWRSTGPSGLKIGWSSVVRFAALVVLAVVAVLATGCGGDDSAKPDQLEPTATAVAPTADVETEVTVEATMFSAVDDRLNPTIPALREAMDDLTLEVDEPLRIGGFATETIDGLAVQPGICRGAEARLAGALTRDEFSRVVEWLGCTDDAGFSDRTESALNRLRFQEPFAIVPLASERFFDEDTLNTDGTPYIGVGSQPAFCGIDNGFGFAVTGALGCPVLEVLGMTATGPVLQAYLAATGKSGQGLRVAHIVDRSVSGDERARARALEVDHVGAELVLVDNSLSVGSAGSDEELATVVLGLIRLDVDVVIVEVSGADALYPFLRSAGFEGDIIGTEVDPGLFANDSVMRTRFSGTYQVVSGLGLVPDDGPGWRQLTRDAAEAKVSADEIGRGFIAGYASMDFFVRALATVDGIEPLNPVDLHDAINSGWSYPGIGGVVCASDWPTAHLLSAPCASVLAVDTDGAVTQLLGPTEFPLVIAEAE